MSDESGGYTCQPTPSGPFNFAMRADARAAGPPRRRWRTQSSGPVSCRMFQQDLSAHRCARCVSDGDDFDEVVEGSEVIRIAGVERKPD